MPSIFRTQVCDFKLILPKGQQHTQENGQQILKSGILGYFSHSRWCSKDSEKKENCLIVKAKQLNDHREPHFTIVTVLYVLEIVHHYLSDICLTDDALIYLVEPQHFLKRSKIFFPKLELLSIFTMKNKGGVMFFILQ